MLEPHGLFISFSRKKETKQRKFAGCIFLPTPVFFSAKQKELAFAQTSFLFLTLRKAPALYGKKKRPELMVFATLLRSLILGAVVFWLPPLFFVAARILRILFVSLQKEDKLENVYHKKLREV